MKRTIIFLALLIGPRWAFAAPTPAQVHAALLEALQIQLTVNQLASFLVQVDGLAQNGYSYTPPASTNSVNLTPAQLTDITNNYQALKAQIQAQLNTLP